MIFILSVFLEFGFSQTKIIKIKDSNLKNTWEEISVLKSNTEIREGIYKRVTSGKLSVEGNYRNGQKIGIWKMYNYFDKVEIEINYDNGLIKYLTKDTVKKADIMLETSLNANKNRPILNVSSSNMVFNYLLHLVKYPEYAAENGISGRVLIAIKVDSQGKIVDYIVKKSIDKSLDEEVIRVIKMMPLEFLPEIKDGVQVDSEMIIPFNFALS
jgi:TonB family protein